MKKFLVLFLICILPVSMLPASMAASDYSFDAQTGTITAYTGGQKTVEIPAEIEGVPVRAIGLGAFDQQAQLEQVILPEGVTHILSNAFYFCENLASIQLPASLQAVDSYAFFGCSKLSNLVLPAGLVFVDDMSFGACAALVQISFLGAAPCISPTAFDAGPEGRQFTVPSKLLADYEALLGTGLLPGPDAAAIPAHSAVSFDSASGAIIGYPGFSADLAIPASIDGVAVTAIAARAFFANPWLRRVVLPEGLTTIGRQAFYACPLAQVSLPVSLAQIGEEAFAASGLKQLDLPTGTVEMGKKAFASTKLASLSLPEGLTSIPEQCFERCSKLETLECPASLQQIGAGAFLNASQLDYLVFAGDTPPELAPDAFLGCDKIADIDIHWLASKAQAAQFQQVFERAGLPATQFAVWRANPPQQPPYPKNAKLTFDEQSQLITGYEGTDTALTMYWNFWKADKSATLDIRGLGPSVFEGSSLEHFSVPHSGAFESIGERAFADSSLRSIYLFDSVKVIGKEAFKNCVNLEEIVLPDSLERIEEGAFTGCSSLHTVTFKGQTVKLEAGAFSGCTSLTTLVLPAASQITGDLGLAPEAYRIAKTATDEQVASLRAALNLPWELALLREGEAVAQIRMPDSFSPNPDSEFEFSKEKGLITKYIGSSARVVVPRAIGGVPVVGIDVLAFSNLTVFSVLAGTQDNKGLEEVILPETVRSIADSAFLNCAALKRLECFGPMDYVGIRSFESCTTLTEVTFHQSIKEMGSYCFHLCSSLKKADLGNKLVELPEGAFAGCGFEGLLTLSLPRVGKLAYQNNKNLTTVHILASVEDLGEGVFIGCDGLQEVCFEQANAEILGEYRFQFDQKAQQLLLHVPENTTDEQLAAFSTKLKQNLLPGENVSRKDCIPAQH